MAEIFSASPLKKDDKLKKKWWETNYIEVTHEHLCFQF